MGLNWPRPVKYIKVKAYSEPIAIDKCCADMVRLIDNLPKTETRWCCCNHGLEKDGSIEFRSELPEEQLEKLLGKLAIAPWQTRKKMLGWSISIPCHCSKNIKMNAMRHFKGRD